MTSRSPIHLKPFYDSAMLRSRHHQQSALTLLDADAREACCYLLSCCTKVPRLFYSVETQYLSDTSHGVTQPLGTDPIHPSPVVGGLNTALVTQVLAIFNDCKPPTDSNVSHFKDGPAVL